MGKVRFLIPTFMFVAGTLVAINLITTVMRNISPTELFPATLSPTLGTDIATIMIIALPILLIEYTIFAVPIAVVILFITRIIKSTRYEMNIMNIGRGFNGTQMIRRAAAPALFSVASSQMFSTVIMNFLFPIGYEPIESIKPLFYASLSLMGALLFAPIALLLFMPTWVLNDAGIVTHLKSESLYYRQCPDTQGVGRWMANMLGGYALLAYPITMFISQFYDPIILPIISGTATSEQLAISTIFYESSLALLWTIGLPFFVMAYLLPVVMFNEAMQSRSTVRILKLAKRLGAKMVKKEQIQEIKRLSSVYDEEKAATVELFAAATNQEIVSTQKTLKMSNKTKIKDSKKESSKQTKSQSKRKSSNPPKSKSKPKK